MNPKLTAKNVSPTDLKPHTATFFCPVSHENTQWVLPVSLESYLKERQQVPHLLLITFHMATYRSWAAS